MLVDVARAVRRGRVEHGAEHPVLSRQRAERRDQLVAHAGGEKPPEAALPVGQPERGVPCAGQLPRAVDEPLQDVVHRDLGRDGEHRVTDRLSGWGSGAPAIAADDSPLGQLSLDWLASACEIVANCKRSQ